ncbi:MAG: 1-deoxy-D-xylulose-5-phosphate reductoisomerase [Candidatus Nanopelagicales bacterium]|nr:1-deoxy-D-xylulose-5-phosphate reductoisomerase [Candidatus Nanopelagicales bacterium]
MLREVVLLGSTGSIGTQALDVMSDHPDGFRVAGLAAGGGNIELLAEQVDRFQPRWVAVPDEAAADRLARALAGTAEGRDAGRRRVGIAAGPDAVANLAARECDVVLNAVTGAAGLPATLSALAAGNRLALANKESLVVGGPLVMRLAGEDQITPVDSEHSAIAQCLRGGTRAEVDRLVLTASGGPFRGWTSQQLASVTPHQALAHPTWDMGPVVTINSATLVNKGLELIEAHLLFDVDLDRIDVVVHPQSVVHSMVTFSDGSTLAQASPPDMRLPIAWALGWPDRLRSKARPCQWTSPAVWEFEPVDDQTFPAVSLARDAGMAGGTAPAVFNAANEVCVEQFLVGNIRLPEIVAVVGRVLSVHRAAVDPRDPGRFVSNGELTLEAVMSADEWARAEARRLTRGSGD